MHTHLLQFTRNMIAFGFCLKDEGRNTTTPSLGLRLSIQNQDISDRPISDNIVGKEIQRGPIGNGDGGIGGPDSSCHQSRHHEVAAATTILFGNSYACIALVSKTFPKPGRKVVGTFNLDIVGLDLVTCK